MYKSLDLRVASRVAITARVTVLGAGSLALSWVEETPMPEGIVDGIVAALESDAPAPAPEPEPEPQQQDELV